LPRTRNFPRSRDSPSLSPFSPLLPPKYLPAGRKTRGGGPALPRVGLKDRGCPPAPPKQQTAPHTPHGARQGAGQPLCPLLPGRGEQGSGGSGGKLLSFFAGGGGDLLFSLYIFLSLLFFFFLLLNARRPKAPSPFKIRLTKGGEVLEQGTPLGAEPGPSDLPPHPARRPHPARGAAEIQDEPARLPPPSCFTPRAVRGCGRSHIGRGSRAESVFAHQIRTYFLCICMYTHPQT